MNVAALHAFHARGSHELGRELIAVLMSLPTVAADLDVLLDQDRIGVAALDRLDRLIERLEGAKRCAAMCRNSIVREREIDQPPTAAA